MKARYIFPVLALALGSAAQAQLEPVSLTDANGVQVNGQTLVVTAELNENPDLTLQQALLTRNITDARRDINVKRYEVSVLPGTQNYFCWTLCYPPEVAGDRVSWAAHEAVTLDADEEFDGFFGDYVPMGIAGSSTFLFVWYDVDNPIDSAWVEIVFTAAEPTGIAESSVVRGFAVYPNPAVGSDITLDYDLSMITAGTSLSLYNMLGERKLMKPLAAAQGRVVLHESELTNGVWFAVLERNGKAIATKRVVVAR